MYHELVQTEYAENIRAECRVNQFVEEIGEASDSCHTQNEGHCRGALPPCSVGEFEMMLVENRTEEEFANNPQDIYCGDHD